MNDPIEAAKAVDADTEHYGPTAHLLARALLEAKAELSEVKQAAINRILLETARAEKAEAQVKTLEAALPETMKHCTILFIECPVGHGRLTATNWIDSGCPHCLTESLAKALREAVKRIEDFGHDYDCGEFPGCRCENLVFATSATSLLAGLEALP